MRSARGFSLVELMISLLLGSVVITGVVQLFVSNSATNKLLEGQSRMQESARFALEFIGRDIRQAGYRGCFSSNQDIRSTIALASMPYEFDLRFAVAGYDGTALGTWTPPLTPLPYTDKATGVDTNVFKTPALEGEGNGIDIIEIATGTDVITTRNLSQIESRLAAELTTAGQNPVIHADAGWDEFKQDHLAMIHDCEKATIFNVTSLSLTGTDMTIGHAQGVNPTSNITEQLAAISTFTTDGAISAIQSHTFFIAPGTAINNAGDIPLSLWRKTGITEPVELVEGIENLQILYGVDTMSGDRVPDQYLQANLVGDWREVVTVRVTVVANSINNVDASTGDGLLRRAFTQTFLLRNHG